MLRFLTTTGRKQERAAAPYLWGFCLSALCAGVLFGCDPDIADPSSTSEYGSLHTGEGPPVLVGLGGSLIAGIQDGALYERAATNGFVNLLAQQMGISDFERPIVPDPGAGFPRVSLLGFDDAGNPRTVRQSFVNGPTNADLPQAYNLLGVPGALVADMTYDGDYSANPNLFYNAVARSKAFGNSLVEQAAGLNPDVLVIWTGNNDVLLWANSGGVGSQILPEPTEAEAFAASYNLLLEQVTNLMPDTEVFVLNIPEITTIPFFSTIPWNVLPLGAEQAAQLNEVPDYKALGFSFQAGANGPVFFSPGSPGGFKQATAEDRILLTLPTDSLASGWGTLTPIPNQYVLDAIEVERVETLIVAYNAAIQAAAAQYDKVTLFDVNAVFNSIKANGYPMIGSSPLTADFISGGIFSLDGVHPCSRGYGAVANELLGLINTQYGADLPQIPLSQLPAIFIDEVAQ